MKPCDLPLLNSLSAPAVHPDALHCVVSVTRPDFGADAYTGQLWRVPLTQGSRPRRLTRGFRDTSPKYSADGSCLGFLRAAPGEAAQLYVLGAGSGEPVRLTDAKLVVSWFSFSPDGSSVVFSARVPEEGRYGTTDGVGPDGEDPRLITTFKYRMNGVGYTADKPLHIFHLALPDLDAEPYIAPRGRAKSTDGDARTASGVPEAVQLTSDGVDHVQPVFSADGGTILFTASPDADASLVSDVFSIRPDGTGLRRLTTHDPANPLSVSDPVESANGHWLFYLGQEVSATGTDFVARNTALYVAPTADPAAVRRLTDPETVDLAEGTIVPHNAAEALVFNRTRGTGELLAADPRGGVEVLVSGPRVVESAGSAGGTVVVTYTDPHTAGDLAIVDVERGGGIRPVTDFSDALRQKTSVAVPVEETHPSRDGYPVHGWLALPEGPGPHPVLVNIHGGPFAQYGWGYFDETQVYTNAGYAVLMCNPRGSAGYGQAHGRSIKEAMGTHDLADVLAFVDGALAAHPELDRDRLGIMGGSYGGYLTAWTIAHDHRFTAAVVERGFLDPLSFVGSADIGWFFSAGYTGTDPAGVAAQSPMACVDAVRTPTLVVHSEQDLRCPVEQAQRYYTALKLRSVPTDLLLFPGENHELSRSGTPWHRRQRFEHLLAWWARWLPTPQNPAPEQAVEPEPELDAGREPARI
ncbi:MULTISPECIES: S9 family peptidase [unclassified Arthrobacter]|uniref:S9 family peptidase n=1 Tax=unclassified Arthrobacter TaxID=235627 RepID=UPI0024DF962B|nr:MULTISPECIES: S9 family peptidase [unclassified Arthrobacter]MCC9145448.1 S9 family peptidase [Arthrobacter sp. zg-Y919]MDK1276676.1 S9 family peptidase [Arthrobacter sp. zg.Y919]WIB04377.1 S9 family peptidase [Arthrobacter sp. zg-Y919]